nr:hypothetical protein [uncultured Desulfobacter sp.]
MKPFTSFNIPKIFGHEDAADEDIERLKQFFLKRGEYDTVKSKLPLSIVVGFKGVGKSALLKIAYEEDIEENQPTLWIRPDDVVEMVEDLSTEADFSKMVLLWKRGVAKLIASRIASDWMFVHGDDTKSAIIWAQETGYRNRDFIQRTVSLLQPKLKNSIDTGSQNAPYNCGEHHIISRLLKNKEIVLYFDDLDAGWEATDTQRRKLSALILALRNMTTDIPGIRARMALRTDVYTLLRESDESTDKFESHIVNCGWKNHDILILLVKRILTYLGNSVPDAELYDKSPKELNDFLGSIMHTKFSKSKVWRDKYTHKVIMSLIRSRPRDMIKLCTLSAKAAYLRDENAKIIEDVDFEKILADYSSNRVQDIVNEFNNELTNIETLIYRMAPTTKEIKEKQKNTYVYTTAQLLQKIKNISENTTFKLAYKESTEPIDVAHFLFKIGFITARKDLPNKIERKHYDEKKQLLKSGQIGDGGYGWEIHPAYRSAISTSQKDAWMNTVIIED